MKHRLVLAVVCVLSIGLCLPALLARVSAEHSMPTAELAVADSALVDWGSSARVVRQLRAAGVDTAVLGMEYDQQDRALGYDQRRVRFLAERGLDVIPLLPKEPPRGASSPGEELADLREAVDYSVVMTSESFHTYDNGKFVTNLGETGTRMAIPDLGHVDITLGDSMPPFRPTGSIIRAHSVTVGPSSDVGELTTQVRRALKERGTRLVVLRGPAPELKAELPLEKALALARSVKAGLPAGLEAGPASAMPAVSSSWPVRLAVVIAALVVIGCAGLALFGHCVLGLGLTGVGCLLSGVVGLGTLASGSALGSLSVRAFALATAIAGATLAVLVIARGSRRRPVVSYALSGLVAVTTGLVIGALGARSEFLVGVEWFSGVKALLLGPLLIIVGVALWDNRTRLSVQRFRELLRPWHLVACGIFLAGLAFYLLRSGNSGLAPAWELALRDWLDETLYIRPRFKEAFLGLPALALAAVWPGRLRWVFAVVGAIGAASIVDSFAHFHTPLLVSLLRTGYSLLIGLALGWLAWIVVRRKVRDS